jgi:hypothetical protein
VKLGPLLGLGLTAAAGYLSGCSSAPAGPDAATLTVEFVTPAEDDGAVLFTISGGPVDSVEAAGYAVYQARIDPTTVRVILSGELTSGAIAHIHIPDDRRLSLYSATLDQVAARATYIQRDPTPYALTLGP